MRFTLPAAALAALSLAGCAGGPAAFPGEVEAGADRIVAESPPQEAAPDSLLERARRIAAAKGLGERPDADSAAREALTMAARARAEAAQPANARAGTAEAQAGAAQSGEDTADLNTRIRLAAMRVRAERDPARAQITRMAGPGEPAPAQAHETIVERAPAASAEDPREIFRRAQERYNERRRTGAQPDPATFGGLSPPLQAAPQPAPTASHYVAAIRQKEAAMADPTLRPLTAP